MRRLWNDDGSNGHLTCNRSTASEPHNDHFTSDDGPALSDEEVNGREAHADGHDGDGHTFECAGEREEVALRLEFKDGFAAVKVLGDSSSPALVSNCHDAVGYLARTGAYMVCGLRSVYWEICVGERVLHGCVRLDVGRNGGRADRRERGRCFTASRLPRVCESGEIAAGE